LNHLSHFVFFRLNLTANVGNKPAIAVLFVVVIIIVFVAP